MASLSFLREADWLDARRVRAYALILVLASLALLANSYFKAMQPAGSDFLAFWGAGHVTVTGDPAAVYDLAVQERIQTGTGATGWFVFVSPPPFLFAAAPSARCPFPSPGLTGWQSLMRCGLGRACALSHACGRSCSLIPARL